MSVAALIPKDVPKEAEAAEEAEPHPHTSHQSHHAHSHSHSQSHGHSHSHSHHPLIHGIPSSDSSDSASEDDTPPSHRPHTHSDDDSPAFDISHTPFAGLYTHLTSSIPLVTSVLLRLLLVTNVVAIVLSLFHVLSPSDDSSCVSLLPDSGAAQWPRLVIGLFFDSTYASAFTTLFAVYELGSRLETQLGSTFFLLTCLAYAGSVTGSYAALVGAAPGLRLYPCSVGAWPLVLPLLVVETWWNRRLPRAFPLVPVRLSPLWFPLLLTLGQQLVFGVHPYALWALGVGYGVGVPMVVAGMWGAAGVERGCTGRWLGGSKRFVSREKAGTMMPWAPLVIKVRPCTHRAVAASLGSRWYCALTSLSAVACLCVQYVS